MTYLPSRLGFTRRRLECGCVVISGFGQTTLESECHECLRQKVLLRDLRRFMNNRTTGGMR